MTVKAAAAGLWRTVVRQRLLRNESTPSNVLDLDSLEMREQPLRSYYLRAMFFAGVETWTLPEELVVTDAAEVSLSAAQCLEEPWHVLSSARCTDIIVFYSTEKTIEAKMMKAGGTEIGKTLAEKSRGLFSANDWQCKTYVDCKLEVPSDVVESNVLHLLVLGFSVS